MNVPVEPLSLGLETAKHALRNLDGVVVAVPRWVDARAKQIGGARLDVLHHELQLLETAVAALGYLVELTARGVPRAILGVFLVRTPIRFELLAQIAHIAPKDIDNRIKLLVEVVGRLRNTYRFAHRRPV